MLKLIAACCPLLVVLYNLDALIENPVGVLGYVIPISLICSCLPYLSASLVRTCWYLGLSIPIVYALVVLMGAPITTHIPETVLLSILLSILAFFPTLHKIQFTSSGWLDITAPFRNTKPKKTRALYGQLYGTLVGAYLGAIPIPLDWDRPWQKWPVTIVIGAVMGTALGEMGQIMVDWKWKSD